jgi:DNA-binding NarL/FixJ family response regulator
MEKELKVLVLEDMELDFLLIQHTLKQSGLRFEAKRVDTKDEFTDALNNYQADIILSDHSLPEFNSIEALKLFNKSGKRIPFLVVTGTDSREFAATCLTEGADDYIVKSELFRLPNAISGAMEKKKRQTERIQSSLELQAQLNEIASFNKLMTTYKHLGNYMRSTAGSLAGLMHLAKISGKSIGQDSRIHFDLMEKSILELQRTAKEIQDYSQSISSVAVPKKVVIREIISDVLFIMQNIPNVDNVMKSIKIEEKYAFYSDPDRLKIIFNHLINHSLNFASDATQPNLKISVGRDKTCIEFVNIENDHSKKFFDFGSASLDLTNGSELRQYIVRETVKKLSGTISKGTAVNNGEICIIEIPNLSGFH